MSILLTAFHTLHILTDFQNFPVSVAFFQDFPVLENATTEFQDFPGFLGPVWTLGNAIHEINRYLMDSMVSFVNTNPLDSVSPTFHTTGVCSMLWELSIRLRSFSHDVTAF